NATIPGRGFSLEAPIPQPPARRRRQNADIDAQRAGHMHCRIGDRENMIHRSYLRGEAIEIMQLIDRSIIVDVTAKSPARFVAIAVHIAILQIDDKAMAPHQPAPMSDIRGLENAALRALGYPSDADDWPARRERLIACAQLRPLFRRSNQIRRAIDILR